MDSKRNKKWKLDHKEVSKEGEQDVTLAFFLPFRVLWKKLVFSGFPLLRLFLSTKNPDTIQSMCSKMTPFSFLRCPLITKVYLSSSYQPLSLSLPPFNLLSHLILLLIQFFFVRNSSVQILFVHSSLSYDIPFQHSSSPANLIHGIQSIPIYF